jgi:hypothetical protein
MKALAALLCIVSLLIPAFAPADQPDPTASLASMLTEETIDTNELHAVMTEILRGEGVTGVPSEGINTQSNILTYVCYYIAFSAVMDFIDCLIYYDISYDCRSAIINGLLFYYFC